MICHFPEKNVSYVNISNEGINFDIERQANESVRWIVHFTAYPWPEVIWYKSGEALTNDMQSKFTVKKDQKMTLLEIRNVSAAESGVYELVIKTSTSQDSRNFTLRVRGMEL